MRQIWALRETRRPNDNRPGFSGENVWTSYYYYYCEEELLVCPMGLLSGSSNELLRGSSGIRPSSLKLTDHLVPGRAHRDFDIFKTIDICGYDTACLILKYIIS